jgi:tetratricopeptide (TPR) repeat protein
MSKRPSRLETKHRLHPLWWLLIAIAAGQAVLAIYGPALHGPFLFDDFSLPFYNPNTRVDELSPWLRGVRPLLMFSYWVNYHFAGKATFWYHLFNLIFHAINSFLIYRIVRRLLEMAGVIDWRKPAFAAFAAALFLLHPVQTESVAYIAGRSESLSALFFLSAFAIYLYQPGEKIGWGRAISVLVLFAAAVCTKEHTATLPAVLLLTDMIWRRESPMRSMRRNWRLYAPIGVATALAAAFVGVVLSNASTAGFRMPGMPWDRYFLTQCWAIFVYVRLFFFPAWQNLDYDVPLSTIADFRSWIGLAALIGLGLIAYRLRKRYSLPAYGYFLFLILLAPTSSIIPIRDLIAERRVYLPMLGLLLVTIGLLVQVRMMSRNALIGLASLVLVIASALTYQRNQLWRSESAIWEDTLAKSPGKVRGYQHLVHGYVSEHRCLDATRRLEQFAKNNPVDSSLLIHWAFASECLNRKSESLQKLDQAAKLTQDPLVLMMIAEHAIRLRGFADAFNALGAALKMNPALDAAYVLRADLYVQEGRLSLAIQDYEQALRANPGNDRARHQLRWLKAAFEAQPEKS